MLRKTIQRWNFLLKAIFLCLVIGLLYREITGRSDLPELWATFLGRFQWRYSGWLIFAVLLVPLNWGLETQKWRELMHRIEPIPYWLAYKAVLAGVAFSVITPNRIGEYGGRVLMVKAEKWQTVVATLVGSVSQMIVLMSAGFFGLVFYVFRNINISLHYQIGMVTGLVLSVSVVLFFYFNIDLAIPIVRRLPYLKRGVKHLEVLREYTMQQLALVLLYALLRYMVYSFQYYLLLKFFGVHINLANAFLTIAFIFFLQTFLPLPPGTALLMRGELAVNIWAEYAHNPITIFAVSFGLWLINVAVPALIGMVFISNINVLKSFGYDNPKS
jgi:uncharacterized membrane protein YbhN (UPF0104 family)